MPFLKLIPEYLFAALLLFGAYAHVFSPEAYEAFLLEFIPEVVANILAAISEAAIGIALILPKYRKLGWAWILPADDCLSAASCLGCI